MDFTRLLVHLEIMAQQLKLIHDHVEFLKDEHDRPREIKEFIDKVTEPNPIYDDIPMKPVKKERYTFTSKKHRMGYAEKCAELQDKGWPARKIAEQMPFSHATVGRLIKEFYDATPGRGK